MKDVSYYFKIYVDNFKKQYIIYTLCNNSAFLLSLTKVLKYEKIYYKYFINVEFHYAFICETKF